MDLLWFFLSLFIVVGIVVFLMWRCYQWGYTDGYNVGYDYGYRENSQYVPRSKERILRSLT